MTSRDVFREIHCQALMFAEPTLEPFPMPRIGRHAGRQGRNAIYPQSEPIFASLCASLAATDPHQPSTIPARLESLGIIGPIGNAQLTEWSK